MGLFDCVGGKQTGTKWAKESQRPKERPRGTSPGFVRSTSRMSKSSLFASNASLGKLKTMDIDQWRTRVLNYLYHGEGKDDIRVLGVPYRQLGFSSVTDFIVAIPPEIYEEYAHIKPDEGLIKEDKVIWQRDGIAEPGVYKWSGFLSDQEVFGLQLDRKKVIPFGTHDGKGLFYCKPGHRAMVPVDEVIPYRKFLRGFIGIVPRKESMTLDLSGASSSKGNPAKQRDKKWKQGDHVYLNQEKKWATIQWTGRIGSDTVVDIVYDKDKPADKRVVSPDEPPISRSLSLAEFINEIGTEDENGSQKPKLLVPPPPPPATKAPSELEDEVFDDVSQVNETTDDSALDDTDDDTETESDDSDDATSTEEEDEEEPMTPPPQRPGTPPAKKMSLENIVLYDDNLQKMTHQKSPKESRKNETLPYDNEKIESLKDNVEGEKRSKSLLSFGFKKNKHAQKEQNKTEEIMKVSSLGHLNNKEKPKPRRFFRRKGSSDGEEFSRNAFKKNRESTMSESGIKVEVEQHLPPKEKSQSVNYIDNNDDVRRLSSDSYSSDYYRPSSPGIKDTGIQMSNAMAKFKEKSKKKDKKDDTKSSRGSLSSFFFPKKNKSSSKDEKLDQLTATEIDIEAESSAAAITPTTKNSSDLVALPDEALTIETEVIEDCHSGDEESIDQEKAEENKAVEEKPRKGKSLISSFFSKKSNKITMVEDGKGKIDIDTARKDSLEVEHQDLVVENPYASASDAENKNSEVLRNSEESLEEDNRLGKGSKVRSSFNFFSRKKKPIPEPVEKDFPGANEESDLIDDNVFRDSIESHVNPAVMNEPPVVKMRQKRKESINSEQERRGSSDSHDKKSSDKEKRSSFRNSFTRRFSLPRRKSSSVDKKDKSKNSLEKNEEKPIKPQRPKSLFSRSNDEDEREHKELNRANSASALVDIQPWNERRAPKVEVLSSFASPVDSSGKKESTPSTSHLPVTPTKSDPDVPKHRMFTTPLRFGSKRSKKSTSEDHDSKEYEQENEGQLAEVVKSPLPSVTSNSSVTPVMAPRDTFIDVTSPRPAVLTAKPIVPKYVESPKPNAAPVTEEVVPVRRVSLRKSSPPAAPVAPPLQRIASIPKSKPAPTPLIRLATPVGYGIKRTVPSGAPVPTVPIFNAKTLSSAIWVPKASSQTNPPISAISVLKSLPTDKEPTQDPPAVATPPPRTTLPELPKSPPPILPKTPAFMYPKTPPLTLPSAPPAITPQSPPPKLPSSPPTTPSQSTPLTLPNVPTTIIPKSAPPTLPKSTPPSLPKSPPPSLPSSPPPVMPKNLPPLPTSPPPILPKNQPTILPNSPPPILPKSQPPILPSAPPSSFLPTTSVPSSPPPVMVTSSIIHTEKPSKPIISDLPLIHTHMATPLERFSTSSEERSPIEKAVPVYYNEPLPSSPVKIKVPDPEPVVTMQSVPIGVTAPLRQSSPSPAEEIVLQAPVSSLPASAVNLSRTPSLDKPPPLPTAPPPNRFANHPVCVTPPTPKTSEVLPIVYATPNPPLKSALKQRKEIECIPRGLKVYDRVLWYNGSTRVPGTVLRLYKDGTDKYTAVVKFDREGLQSPLTLVREGDAYEVTVEELLPTEVYAHEEQTNDNEYPSALNGNTSNATVNVVADKDSDDGLRKSSLKGPSVQFRNPSVDEVQAEINPSESGSVTEEEDGDGTMPPAFVEEEINIACGMRRGIQSTEMSSCLETLLFSMFYTTNVFDTYMLFENPYEDQPSTKEIKAILRTEIVKPLRETGYVGIEAMNHLQETMLPLSTDLNSLASKAEVMMFILFQRALNLREFITYSSDIFDYHHQILLNHKDPSKCVTTQYLLENSLQLMDNFLLKTIPTPALILEMPRTNNKMVQYDAVVPNLTLNIGHLLENGPKICLCGMVAKFDCRYCVAQTHGNSSIVYCDSCRGMSDQIHHQLGHNPVLSPIDQINGLMDLVAVICVNKGHYVSYVKCGIERLSPWLYYDATVDEAPRVSIEQHLGMWLDRLEKYPGKYRDAFAHSLLAQLLTDNHICIYQSRQKGSYV